MPRHIDISKDYYAVVGLNFETIAKMSDRDAEIAIREAFDARSVEHDKKTLHGRGFSTTQKNQEHEAYKAIKEAKRIVYPEIRVGGTTVDPEARARRKEYEGGRAQLLLQLRLTDLDKIKVPDIYGFLGLDYNTHGNRYGQNTNAAINLAIKKITDKHNENFKAAGGDIKARDREMKRWKALPPFQELLGSEGKRRAFDIKYGAYLAMKSRYAGLGGQATRLDAGAQQAQIVIVQRVQELEKEHLAVIKKEQKLEDALISIVSEEKKLESRRASIVDKERDLEKEKEKVIHQEQKLADKHVDIVEQVQDLEKERSNIIEQEVKLESQLEKMAGQQPSSPRSEEVEQASPPSLANSTMPNYYQIIGVSENLQGDYRPRTQAIITARCNEMIEDHRSKMTTKVTPTKKARDKQEKYYHGFLKGVLHAMNDAKRRASYDQQVQQQLEGSLSKGVDESIAVSLAGIESAASIVQQLHSQGPVHVEEQKLNVIQEQVAQGVVTLQQQQAKVSEKEGELMQQQQVVAQKEEKLDAQQGEMDELEEELESKYDEVNQQGNRLTAIQEEVTGQAQKAFQRAKIFATRKPPTKMPAFVGLKQAGANKNKRGLSSIFDEVDKPGPVGKKARVAPIDPKANPSVRHLLRVPVTDHPLKDAAADWAKYHSKLLEANKSVVERRQAENINYGQHLYNIKDVLQRYKKGLESVGPIKDDLYSKKLFGVNELLETLKDLEVNLSPNETEKKIKSTSMSWEKSNDLVVSVNDKNAKLASMAKIVGDKLASPLGEKGGKSIAEVFSERRTKLGWTDTGKAVLKAIVTALSYMIILPAVLTKLITQKSVQSHMFPVKGREVSAQVVRSLDAIEDAKKSIDQAFPIKPQR